MVKLENTTHESHSDESSLTLEIVGIGTSLALFITGVLIIYLSSVVFVLDQIEVLTYQIVLIFFFTALTSNLVSKVFVAFVKHLL